MARKEKKYWFTVAWLTLEGAPNPAHGPHHNFVPRYCSPRVLREDLVYGMTHFSRGASVAAAWRGQLTKDECLNSPARPLFYVHGDGHVERP